MAGTMAEIAGGDSHARGLKEGVGPVVRKLSQKAKLGAAAPVPKGRRLRPDLAPAKCGIEWLKMSKASATVAEKARTEMARRARHPRDPISVPTIPWREAIDRVRGKN